MRRFLFLLLSAGIIISCTSYFQRDSFTAQSSLTVLAVNYRMGIITYDPFSVVLVRVEGDDLKQFTDMGHCYEGRICFTNVPPGRYYLAAANFRSGESYFRMRFSIETMKSFPIDVKPRSLNVWGMFTIAVNETAEGKKPYFVRERPVELKKEKELLARSIPGTAPWAVFLGE